MVHMFRRKSKTGTDGLDESDAIAVEQQQRRATEERQRLEQEQEMTQTEQAGCRKSRFRPFGGGNCGKTKGSNEQKKQQKLQKKQQKQQEKQQKKQQKQQEQTPSGAAATAEASDGRDDVTEERMAEDMSSSGQRSFLGSFFAGSAETSSTQCATQSRSTELDVAVDDSGGDRNEVRDGGKSMRSRSSGAAASAAEKFAGAGVGWGPLFGKSKEDDDISNIEVVYKDFGDDAGELLKLMLHDAIPEPKEPDDVVVRVEASTVSLTDCIIRRGMWYESIQRPITPGFDLVGKVHSVGSEVKNFVAGDRVAALVRTGGNARYATVPSSSLVTVPSAIDSAEAVSVVSTYMTAFQALDLARGDRPNLQGAKVLITGGNGAMGQALIELAKLFDCTDIFASASEKYHARLKYGLGATCLPSDPRLWLPQVEGQMDIVIDSICRDGYESPHRALSEKGKLVCIGVTSILYSEDEPGVFGPPAKAVWASMKAKMLMKKTTTYEVWESFQNDPEKFKEDLEYLFNFLKKNDIRPNIVQKVRLSEVAEAHRTIESCGASGQIVCLPWKKFAYKKPEATSSSKAGGVGEVADDKSSSGGVNLVCCR